MRPPVVSRDTRQSLLQWFVRGCTDASSLSSSASLLVDDPATLADSDMRSLVDIWVVNNQAYRARGVPASLAALRRARPGVVTTFYHNGGQRSFIFTAFACFSSLSLLVIPVPSFLD